MKRVMSVIMIVLIVCVMLMSMVEASDAMVPVAPLVGALTKEVVARGLLASYGMIWVADNVPGIVDDLVPFVNLSGLSYGTYGSNGFAVSVPNQDFIYNWLMDRLGGYGLAHVVSSGFVPDDIRFHPRYNLSGLVPSLASNLYNSLASPHKVMTVRDLGNDRFSCLISFSDYPISLVDGTFFAFDSIGAKMPISCYSYDTSYPPAYLWINNSLNGVPFPDQAYIKGFYWSDFIPVPESVWNPQYITPQGINYNTWVAQPSGRYYIDIPVTPNDLGEYVVDDVALGNQTTDIARVDEYVMEYKDKVVVPVSPWSPEVPVTDPLPEPVPEVSTDTFLDRLWAKFINLFILPDGYLIDNFKAIQNEIPMLAFPAQIIADLHSISGLSGDVIRDITVTAWGGTHTVVDFQGLRDFLPTIQDWVRGVIFILLLLYNYDQVYKAIRGTSYGFGSGRGTPTSLGGHDLPRLGGGS